MVCHKDYARGLPRLVADAVLTRLVASAPYRGGIAVVNYWLVMLPGALDGACSGVAQLRGGL